MKQPEKNLKWYMFISRGSLFFVLAYIFPRLSLIDLVESLTSRQGADILSTSLNLLTILGLAVTYYWADLTQKNYFYELADEDFKKEHGVINKKYVTIPYERIQNVDIHRNLLDRQLGLSQLKIQTAGAINPGSYGASAEGYLPGLDPQEAEWLREELIRRSTRL